MGILAKPLGWLLSQLYSVVGNYGISLIIITIIVKLILYPFYKKQEAVLPERFGIRPVKYEVSGDLI